MGAPGRAPLRLGPIPTRRILRPVRRKMPAVHCGLGQALTPHSLLLRLRWLSSGGGLWSLIVFRCFWLAAYVGAVLLANIFLDSFIQLPAFGLFSIGSIFFAAVFTLRDRLHGYGIATVMLGIALALAVNTVFGLATGLSARFLVASFTSIILSEVADTAVFQRLRGQGWHVRVLASNAVSVPLDSTAFTLLAFAGTLGSMDLAQIVFADIAGKYLIAAGIAWLPFITQRARVARQGTSLRALYSARRDA